MILRSVQEILEECLGEHGYDGLLNEENDCSCELDALCPCGSPYATCSPGHKVKCDCGNRCEFHISPEKEAEE